MELFTLLVNPVRMSAERITAKLREALESLHIKPGVLELCVVPLRGGTGIVCDVAVGFRENSLADEILKKAAVVLAEEMLASYEERFMARCISKQLDGEQGETMETVLHLCRQLSCPPDEFGETENFESRRLNKLAKSIENYLSEEPLLHMEGFWEFRTKDLKEELQEVVLYALEEWTMEQQYQEFISLLKYFVYLQEAKIPAAHVVYRENNEFTLLDDRMLPMEMKQVDQLVTELIDKDVNHEDVIVSTLVSMSPGKLYIHTQTPEQQIIKTIMTIFEGRAELCESCHVCSFIPEERKQK